MSACAARRKAAFASQPRGLRVRTQRSRSDLCLTSRRPRRGRRRFWTPPPPPQDSTLSPVPDAVQILHFPVQLLSCTNRHQLSDRSVRSENTVFLPHSLTAMYKFGEAESWLGNVSKRSGMQFVRVRPSSLLQQVPPAELTLSRLVSILFRLNLGCPHVTGQLFLSLSPERGSMPKERNPGGARKAIKKPSQSSLMTSTTLLCKVGSPRRESQGGWQGGALHPLLPSRHSRATSLGEGGSGKTRAEQDRTSEQIKNNGRASARSDTVQANIQRS